MDIGGVPDISSEAGRGLLGQPSPRSGGAEPSRSYYFLAKRLTDTMLSGVALLLLSPLLLLVAIAIKIDSPGPIIFRQARIGFDMRARRRRTFVMYKFRTMFHNSDQAVHRKYVTDVIVAGSNPDLLRDSEGFLKVTHDRRVTRVGRLLRRLAIDELPQLWNVLKGDMSLVGPRPALPYEVDVYLPHHMRRLDVLPGCTGLWQVRGWCKLSFEEMVSVDIEYVERQSFWLDVQILLGTVPAILARRGGG